MENMTPTLHALTVDNRHVGYIDVEMMRDQIDLLSKLSGLATDEDYDNVVGILETLEAIVKVVDPSGNDPSFDLSRCPKCDSSNVIFEGTQRA